MARDNIKSLELSVDELQIESRRLREQILSKNEEIDSYINQKSKLERE